MARRGCSAWLERLFVLIVTLDFTTNVASAQLRYSIAEELMVGAVVGNIAKDLGLDNTALNARGFRIVSGSTEPLFELNNHGILHVHRKIDREEVCERTSSCIINLKTVLENPLEVHYVAIEVLDVNPEEEEEIEGANVDLDSQRKGLKFCW